MANPDSWRSDRSFEADAELFGQLADTLPIMVCRQDENGLPTYTNAAWHDVTGLPRTPESYEPETWRRVVHPDDYDRMIDTLATAVNRQANYDLEFRLRRAGSDDSSYRWYYAKSSARFVDGKFVGWLGSVVDVQETRYREDAERRLRDEAMNRERQFRALAEAVPQIVWTADASGALDWYNHGWYDYTGQTPEEAAGWGWQAVHHPEDFPLMMKQWTDALACGEKTEMEFRLRGRDGKYRWFLTLVNPYKDENGRVIRWFGTNTDIHERKINVERSKRVAQTLQEAFLPERLPQSELLTFDAVYVPAESDAFVGGDWYDAFTRDDNRIVISIGDVAGHGLDAAVIAGRLRHTIFSEALDDDNPANALRKADRVLRAQTNTFATAFVAIVNPDTGKMVYASAGHPNPVISPAAGQATFLPGGSAPLGTGFVEGGLRPNTYEVLLQPDSLLVFHTDGITEFGRDIVAGQARLLATVDRIRAGVVSSTARDLLASALNGSSPVDDIAIVLVRWRPADAPIAAPAAPLLKHWRFHSSHAHSAHNSRHELMSFIRTHALDATADDFAAEIILGELLSNTVEHAPGLVEISIDWTGEWPLLTMRDGGGGFESNGYGPTTDELSEDGRGLFLVRSLSRQFHVKSTSAVGTTIEVELPVRRTRV